MQYKFYLFIYLSVLSCTLLAEQQDSVSILPQQWEKHLSPILIPDLTGADISAQNLMKSIRKQLSSDLESRQKNPETVSTGYGKLGALYQVNLMPALAEICYRNALELAPKIFRWRYYSARLAEETGKSELALSQYQQAMKLMPNYSPIQLRIGKTHLDLNQIEDATLQLNDLKNKDGVAAAANFRLGQIALLERKYQQAVEHLEKTLTIDPGASAIHFPLSQALRAIGENQRAKQHLKQSGEKLPVIDDIYLNELSDLNIGVNTIFSQALHAVQAGDYVTAKEKFRQALILDPNNQSAKVSYARVLYLSGNPQEAEQVLMQVLDFNEHQPDASFFVALIINQHSGDNLAETRYQNTLNENPDHSGAHFYLANLMFRSGRYQQAIEHYEQAIKLDDTLLPAKFYRLMAKRFSGSSANTIIKSLNGSFGNQPALSLITYAVKTLQQKNTSQLINDPYLIPKIADPTLAIRDYPSAKPF